MTNQIEETPLIRPSIAVHVAEQGVRTRRGWRRCQIDRNVEWENLHASSFEAGAAPSFSKEKITPALREYAIAGALHLDNFAGLKDSPANARTLALSAFQLSRALGEPEADIRAKLDRLIVQHEGEWRSFMHSLGPTSFLADWAVKGRS